MDPRAIVPVLDEITETASRTLELQDVIEHVAASIKRLIPLDNVCVVRILDGQWGVLHATTAECDDDPKTPCDGPMPLADFSERMRPRPGPIFRIDDAEAELDRSFPGDAALLQAGVRSGLWHPFRTAGNFTGGVWVSAMRPHAFTEEHQEILAPIASVLGSAVEHWRIWNAERRRHERLDALEPLLATLAGSLDIREVFEQISTAVQPILPHHLLVLTELDAPGKSFRIAAFVGESDSGAAIGPIPLTDEEFELRSNEYEIYRDIQMQASPTSPRGLLLRGTGMRSWLRVPVRLSGKIGGGVGFFHREPSRYAPEDAEIAQRLADRIALTLSHQRLAEEARVAAEARDRADRLEATVETLTRELEARGGRAVVGVSSSWKEVLFHVGRVASSDTTVLITGESGTGKEVVARLIHQGSPRSGRQMVAINCAALPEQLLESELFGHEKGAFTGALATKIGRIEQAAGGTLFLDEIAEMSPLVQAKFLRVLQEREFQRLGGTKTLRADVRVLAATNRDLRAGITQGTFREDLYYRLNVFEIPVPSLRSRPDDILPLAEYFLEDLGRSMGRPAAGISRDAREWLESYAWPGNVRELRNAIERAILLCDGGLITREHLPALSAVRIVPPAMSAATHGPVRSGAPAAAPGNGGSYSPAAAGAGRLVGAAAANGNGGTFSPADALAGGSVDLAEVDRSFVERALQEAGGNKSKAARMLGLTRSQLYSRLERYNLLKPGSEIS